MVVSSKKLALMKAKSWTTEKAQNWIHNNSAEIFSFKKRLKLFSSLFEWIFDDNVRPLVGHSFARSRRICVKGDDDDDFNRFWHILTICWWTREREIEREKEVCMKVGMSEKERETEATSRREQTVRDWNVSGPLPPTSMSNVSLSFIFHS